MMLSGETARGRHPAEALSMMARIAREVDPTLARTGGARLCEERESSVDGAVAHAAAQVALAVGARRIVAYPVSGSTAHRIARYRPLTPLVAISPHAWVCRRLNLSWGVLPIQGPSVVSLDDLPAQVEALCAARDLARPGDLVVITAGAPLDVAGTTNCLCVHRLAAVPSKQVDVGPDCGGPAPIGSACRAGRRSCSGAARTARRQATGRTARSGIAPDRPALRDDPWQARSRLGVLAHWPFPGLTGYA